MNVLLLCSFCGKEAQVYHENELDTIWNFDVSLTVHLSIFISVINQLDAHNFCFTISLFHHTYKCDDTRGCVMQFWPPDDEHISSKHVEAWNKLIVKQKVCASSRLITEINNLKISHQTQVCNCWLTRSAHTHTHTHTPHTHTPPHTHTHTHPPTHTERASVRYFSHQIQFWRHSSRGLDPSNVLQKWPEQNPSIYLTFKSAEHINISHHRGDRA